MKPEIKEKWIAALRSGEFKQTQKRLRKDDTYCCLGVLCELYRRETGLGAWTLNENVIGGVYNFLGRPSVPPQQVREWAGLSQGNRSQCIVVNDKRGSTFNEVANFIDTEL